MNGGDLPTRPLIGEWRLDLPHDGRFNQRELMPAGPEDLHDLSGLEGAVHRRCDLTLQVDVAELAGRWKFNRAGVQFLVRLVAPIRFAQEQDSQLPGRDVRREPAALDEGRIAETIF